MTGMLASVASLEEAKTVLEHRVDIIDLKNPKLGALGQLDCDTISSVVELVNNQLPVSATIGDIKPNDSKLYNRIINTADLGVNFVKVGLFSKNIPNYFLDTINDCCRKNINIIIVIFAENFIGMDLLESLITSNISGIMLDTKNKSSKNLCSLMRYKTLEKFIKVAKENNLITGLAGSLKTEDIDSLISLNPDYLGFRGALCMKKDRVKTLDEKSIIRIRDIISGKNIVNCENIITEEVAISGTVA
tara:strand:+ start:986 stop:1726 length:741 start_codon:yes stop_codon:yes gene_type:complete